MNISKLKTTGLIAALAFSGLTALEARNPFVISQIKAIDTDDRAYRPGGTVEFSVSTNQGESFTPISRTSLRRGTGIAFTSFLRLLPETSLVKVEADFRSSRSRGEPETYVFVDNPKDVAGQFTTLLEFRRLLINSLEVPVEFRTEETIEEVALKDERFTTLVAALGAADLVGVLDSEGPFTVFAPTNQAFDKLGGLVGELLKPENKDTLVEILTYHVVAGQELPAAKIVERATIGTFEGRPVSITVDAEGVLINDSRVIIKNILTANGVIHAIDTVLVPEEAPKPTLNIAETADAAGVFTTLLGAVEATGIGGALIDTDNPVTVFAPTDEAFANLPDGLLESLTIDQLRQVLLYHVASGAVDSATLFTLDEANPLQGEPISVNGDLERINDSDFITLDIPTTTGPIHIIDRVLIPPSFL